MVVDGISIQISRASVLIALCDNAGLLAFNTFVQMKTAVQ